MENWDKKTLLGEISNKVKEIRNNLNLRPINFEIVDIEIFYGNECCGESNKNNKINRKTLFLKIYTLTRSDKSAIIGPGGWVVGRLRETLKNKFKKNLIIIVEDYVDKLISEEKRKNAISILKGIGLKKGQEVLYLLQCSYDLSVLGVLRDYFKVFALSLDIGPVVLPPKNKELIETYVYENDIPHEFITPIKLNKKDILMGLAEYPCDTICNKMNKYILKESINRNINHIINNHISEKIKRDEVTSVYFINFLKVFQLKKNSLRSEYLNCPLMIQSYRKNKNVKIKLIKEIVSETYNGLMEPTEGSEKIMDIAKKT
ncbi:MAG TPA: hypothetical protein EYG76_04000 [Methanothermococcus okinawensis]|uniref:Uncharacterized protein n=1 Tax=Methanothermococcus okinawensis TaxID=155863 RepID=A0A832YNL5_9EURY|nr:hypothetical protein [Methanothermococcus okinawensis]